MEFNRYNHNKKRNRTWIVLSIIAFIIVVAAGSWIGYNGWNINRSLDNLVSVWDSQKKGGEGEMIPTGGDPTETQEVPEPQQTDPETVPEVPKQPEEKPEVTPSEQPPTEDVKTPAQPEQTTDSGGYIEGVKLPEKPTYINGILIANKKNPLPQDFAPGESKEAREAFDKMAAEAKLAGFELVAFSTYRSFDYQTTLYNRYVAKDGQEAADRYSARPGFSEHQTGLAFDIGEKNFEQYWADSEFGNTPAGQWVAENAHKYGFILRYPKGKEEITGYMHESWHFRYVGEGIARDVYIKGVTLEEYLNIQ
jgi:zinc D-Ala-D-Ala carboxypeptidase